MFGHEGGCEDREKIAEDNEKSKKCAYPHSREDIKEAGATVFNQKIVCIF